MKRIILFIFLFSGLGCFKVENIPYCGKVIGYDNNDHHGYTIDTVTGNHIVLKILFSDSLIDYRVVLKTYHDTSYCECCK